MDQFLPRPRRVTPGLTNVCQRIYPGMSKDPFYARLLDYILFCTWRDDTDPERIVITHELVWQMKKGLSGRASIRKLLKAFEQDMQIKLDAQYGCSFSGRATTLEPEVDPQVLAELNRSLRASSSERTAYLVPMRTDGCGGTGHRSARCTTVSPAKQAALDAVRALDQTSEQARLLNALNGRSARYVARRLRHGAKEASTFLDGLSSSDARQEAMIGDALKVLQAIEDDPQMVYGPSVGTTRIYARGQHVNSLPRLVRKLVLALAADDHADRLVELDLSYAQLAIAGWRWELPKLTRLLQKCEHDGTSVWTVFLRYCGLDEEHKPILKKTVYSICYGMSVPALREQFLCGYTRPWDDVPGVGDPAIWQRLRRHPVIRELLRARSSEAWEIKEKGGAYDAFGNWISREKDDGTTHTPSILAVTAQSWEQHVMYGMIPILEKNKQIYVFSYLHDGLTVYFGDMTKMDRQLQALCRRVERPAKGLGIQTRLQLETLNAEDLKHKIREIICPPQTLRAAA